MSSTTRSRRPFVPSTLVLLAALAAPATAETGRVDREYHESFEVRSGDRLVLRHGDGDVRIAPWDRDELEVEVVYHAEYSEGGLGISGERDFEVDFRRTGRDVRVSGRELGGGGIRLGWSSMKVLEHLYTVRAPAWLELDLRGEDGDVEIDDWTGPTAVRLEDGDLRLDRFAGRLEAVLEDGDISLRDCRLEDSRFDLADGDVALDGVEGDFRLVTADGDVTARRLTPGRASVRTDDGDVALELLPTEELDLEVRTRDGDAELELAAGLSARFEVTTDDGRIRIGLPGSTDLRETEHEVHGSLGGGDGRIVVRTDDGTVALRSGG